MNNPPNPLNPTGNTLDALAIDSIGDITDFLGTEGSTFRGTNGKYKGISTKTCVPTRQEYRTPRTEDNQCTLYAPNLMNASGCCNGDYAIHDDGSTSSEFRFLRALEVMIENVPNKELLPSIVLDVARWVRSTGRHNKFGRNLLRIDREEPWFSLFMGLLFVTGPSPSCRLIVKRVDQQLGTHYIQNHDDEPGFFVADDDEELRNIMLNKGVNGNVVVFKRNGQMVDYKPVITRSKATYYVGDLLGNSSMCDVTNVPLIASSPNCGYKGESKLYIDNPTCSFLTAHYPSFSDFAHALITAMVQNISIRNFEIHFRKSDINNPHNIVPPAYTLISHQHYQQWFNNNSSDNSLSASLESIFSSSPFELIRSYRHQYSPEENTIFITYKHLQQKIHFFFINLGEAFYIEKQHHV